MVPRLVAAGHEVVVLTVNPGDLPPVRVEDGATVLRPPVLSGLQRAGALRRRPATDTAVIAAAVARTSRVAAQWLRRELPLDVVAFHDTTSGPWGALRIARELPVPLVFHVHSTETTMTGHAVVPDPLGMLARAERRVAAAADRIVALTEDQRALLVRHGWPADRIRVVPHGVDAPAVSGVDIRAAYGIPAGAPLLVFAGRLVPVKGIETLLRALPRIPVPDLHLLVVGESKGGGVAPGLERLAPPRVVFTRRFLPASDVAAAMATADVCVVPSTFEPFGLVALEAMALGRPVVLGPGCSPLLAGPADQPSSLRVPAAGEGPLATAITGLLADPARAALMGKVARERVRTEFTPDAVVRRTLEIYEEVRP
jgi:D-inositol-3-phosphate glycosyltransferase/glycogen(starch) synthase